MYKLGFEEAEESEIKLPTFIGSWRKQRNSRKTSTSDSLTTLKPLTVWLTTNYGKFLNRQEYQTTLPASWEICMQIKEKKNRTRLGTTDWFKIGKGVWQGCILSPCLFNLYAEYIMRNAGLEEAQAGIKIAGRNINNLRYIDGITLMVECEEELKSLLMRVKRESEKAGLKLNAEITKIMVSGPITQRQLLIEGEKWKQWQILFSWAPKSVQTVTAVIKLKQGLLLGRKVMTNLGSVLTSRDITLLTKDHIVKSMVVAVVMYGCESWTIKKAECQRINAFKLWCWRRLLRVTWTARISNQSVC